MFQQFQVLCKWHHHRSHAQHLLQPLYLLRHVAPPVKHTSNEAAELIHLQLLLAKPLWTCTSYTVPTRRYLYRCWLFKQPLPPTSCSSSHFDNKLSRKTLLALVGPRPTVPYHPFFSLAFHRTKDTLHRMPRQPWIINSSVHGLCILLSCCRVSPRIATSVPAPSTPHSVQEP